MNIHCVGKNKVIVELSSADMLELDITYEDMDYSNIETRRVIWTILEKVRDSLGRDIDPFGNLLIEAAADIKGGCVLCFTVPNEKKPANQANELTLTKNTNKVIYEFDNMDSLLDMIKTGGYKNIAQSSQIFTDKSRVRLVLSQSPAPLEKKAIEEFGVFIGRDTLSMAQTAEHWQQAGIL